MRQAMIENRAIQGCRRSEMVEPTLFNLATALENLVENLNLPTPAYHSTHSSASSIDATLHWSATATQRVIPAGGLSSRTKMAVIVTGSSGVFPLFVRPIRRFERHLSIAHADGCLTGGSSFLAATEIVNCALFLPGTTRRSIVLLLVPTTLGLGSRGEMAPVCLRLMHRFIRRSAITDGDELRLFRNVGGERFRLSIHL